MSLPLSVAALLVGGLLQAAPVAAAPGAVRALPVRLDDMLEARWGSHTHHRHTSTSSTTTDITTSSSSSVSTTSAASVIQKVDPVSVSSGFPTASSSFCNITVVTVTMTVTSLASTSSAGLANSTSSVDPIYFNATTSHSHTHTHSSSHSHVHHPTWTGTLIGNITTKDLYGSGADLGTGVFPLSTGGTSTSTVTLTSGITTTNVNTNTATSTPSLTSTFSGNSSTSDSTIFTAGTPLSTTSSSTTVINTSIQPVTTAAVTSVPSSTVSATSTAIGTIVPAGPPDQGAVLCGVHGEPVGDYFISRFVFEDTDKPVTGQGCYQFCQAAANVSKGCKAYRFYLDPQLQYVPRCDLFSARVAYDVAAITLYNQPNYWFDLRCGDPTAAQFASLNISSIQPPPGYKVKKSTV